MCASMWFSYALTFFHKVVRFSDGWAGNLVLLGQVVNAVCTPLVGFVMDRCGGFCKYTKRKSWHLIGRFIHSTPHSSVTTISNTSRANHL